MNLLLQKLNGTVLFIGLLFLSNIIIAQSKTEKIDQLISTYEAYGKFNGSVLIAEQGKVIFKKGYGMANMEWDIPNQPNTKHRLGSITKQFTALLILQLAEKGKIDLYEPISTYLPEYPKETGTIITTHHLLTHTSGIPNYTSFQSFMKEKSRDHYTPKEFLKVFNEKELDFKPGEKFSYSNSGYFLLGVLLEEITGTSYEDLLKERIFIPLNMNDTGYDHHHVILKNRATGYDKQGINYRNSKYLDMSIPYAAGSMYSTVEDLFKWDQALYKTTLLSKEYRDLFFKPYITAFEDFSYAYGWLVGEEGIGNSDDKIQAISHSGGIHGFNTNISRVPSDKSLIVLLSNTGNAPLNSMTRGIRGVLYDKDYDFPKKSVADNVLAKIESDGIDAGIKYFHKIKDDKNFQLRESEMNIIGYKLMEDKKYEDASKVFQLNVDAFPNSSNTYDSLGESYMKMGNKELAIKNYRKSVELNPNNQMGIKYLKELGDDVSDLQKEIKVDDAILALYIGKYELRPGFILTITKEGNQLKAQATGQPIVDIFPKSNTEFYLKVTDAQLEFHKNSDGNVDSVTLYQGGGELKGNLIK